MGTYCGFVLFLLLAGSSARHVRTNKQQKTRKYSVPYPQTSNVIQGVTYPCGGSPCSSNAGMQSTYPAAMPQQQSGQCCPSGGSSCCGATQSPPCCITIQPYSSKNLTVNAPSKVTLEINILPVKENKTGSTPKPSPAASASTPASSTVSTTATISAGSTPTKPSSTASTAGPTTQAPADQVSGANEIQHFRAEALAESNRQRSVHLTNGLSDAVGNLQNKLILDEGLNIAAQNYAQKIATERKPAHSNPASRPQQGENIAVACNVMGKPLSGKNAAKMWYDEVKRYQWDLPGYSPKTGHFTQAVWKGSKKVGFGRAKYTNDKGSVCSVVVARYSPRGNIKGFFPQNVLKGNYMNI